MKKNRKKNLVALLSTSLVFLQSGCGGGGSDGDGGSLDSELLIEGTLTEAGGGGADHSRAFVFKHSEGNRLGNVQVCALGKCSTTDDKGQWSFAVDDKDFAGGNLQLSLTGHGIDTSTSVNVPKGSNQVFLQLHHVEGARIIANHVTIDGETSHSNDKEHTHETL
ncbi:MAG: hypothetical protein V4671_19140 [Armatimonadota bacterium]